MRIKAPFLAALALSTFSPLTAEARPPYEEWGTETLEMIHKDYWLPRHKLYSEFAPDKNGRRSHPAFMWGVGVQLSALAAAAKIQPDPYLEQTKSYADAIQVYWLEHNGLKGYDVQPGPKESDRYYDDNAWLVLALAEVFELTKDEKYLAQSKATFDFVMSGEDDKLGGGLYWRELHLTSKNTCTNAPTIVSALRLHALTKDAKYLDIAKRVYAWTNSKLQDKDGLYWDNINMSGRVDERKFSYNTALMIRANCLFHEITGEKIYLDEAKRVAESARKHWVSNNGAMSDSGRFAHLLLESFIELYQIDKDPRWPALTEKCLTYVHSNLKGEDGRYSHRWDRRGRGGPKETEILNQSSPARAYWFAADAFKK